MEREKEALCERHGLIGLRLTDKSPRFQETFSVEISLETGFFFFSLLVTMLNKGRKEKQRISKGMFCIIGKA